MSAVITVLYLDVNSRTEAYIDLANTTLTANTLTLTADAETRAAALGASGAGGTGGIAAGAAVIKLRGTLRALVQGSGSLRVLAAGCLTPQHATQFLAYIRQVRSQYALDKILSGQQPWPDKPEERDVLYFLAQSLRARLVKELPPERSRLSADSRALVLQAKDRITELADLSLEIARMAVTPEDGRELPDWFVVELFRDLPRLADKRNG